MLKIKELREEKGWSQKELAEKINSTNKNIWAYENEIAYPSIETLIRLSDVFQVSIDFLVSHEDDFGNVPQKPSNGAELSPAEWDFIRKMRALDPRHVKVLEMQLETLTELQAESLKK